MQEFLKNIRIISAPQFIRDKINEFVALGAFNKVYKGALFSNGKGGRIRRLHRYPIDWRKPKYPFYNKYSHKLFQNFNLNNFFMSDEEGEDYAKLLDGDFSNCEVIRQENLPLIFLSILMGLNYLHQQNIFHADLKLQNIFYKIDKDGNPYPYIADLDGAEKISIVDGKFNDVLVATFSCIKDPIAFFINRNLDLKENDCFALTIFCCLLYLAKSDNPQDKDQYNTLQKSLSDLEDEYIKDMDHLYREEITTKIIARNDAINQTIDSINDPAMKEVFLKLNAGKLKDAINLPFFEPIKRLFAEKIAQQEEKLKKYSILEKSELIKQYPRLMIYPRSIQLILSDAHEILKKKALGKKIDQRIITEWSNEADRIINKYPMPELQNTFETTKKLFQAPGGWNPSRGNELFKEARAALTRIIANNVNELLNTGVESLLSEVDECLNRYLSNKDAEILYKALSAVYNRIENFDESKESYQNILEEISKKLKSPPPWLSYILVGIIAFVLFAAAVTILIALLTPAAPLSIAILATIGSIFAKVMAFMSTLATVITSFVATTFGSATAAITIAVAETTAGIVTAGIAGGLGVLGCTGVVFFARNESKNKESMEKIQIALGEIETILNNRPKNMQLN